MRSLAAHLGLAEPPRWIEGFDISHTQGVESVASLIVWREGRLRKGDYRSFNMRDLDGPDDFRSIEQAVERRYRRLLEESGQMPDLILIDGGRGQLNAALAALARLGVEEVAGGRARQARGGDLPAGPARAAAPAPLRPRAAAAAARSATRPTASRSRATAAGAARAACAAGSTTCAASARGASACCCERFGTLDRIRAATEAELAAAVGPALAARLRASSCGEPPAADGLD